MILIKKVNIYLDSKGYKRIIGLFKCVYCLKEVERELYGGIRQKSCGCISTRTKYSKKHGGTNTKLYNIYRRMKSRCSNLNNKNYGGRGIIVCTEWLDKDNGFINFRDWALNSGYTEDLEIDRINNNGNYEPSNCRWVTHEENSQNQNTTKLCKEIVIEIRNLWNTGNYTQTELSKKYSVNFKIIHRVINRQTWKNII